MTYLFTLPMTISEEPAIVGLWRILKSIAWEYPLTVISLHAMIGFLVWYFFLREHKEDRF